MAGMSNYRAPAASANEDTRVGWLRETVQMGDQWLKGQRAWRSIADSKRLILDGQSAKLTQDVSRVSIPRAKRQVRELVSIMANLRPTASNKTDNPDLWETANVLNKIDQAWWYNTFADRRFKDSFQAAAVTGTVYVSHGWDTDLAGWKRGDIYTSVYGAEEVLLINPPKNHDLQRCYAVVIKERVPIHIVHGRFPLRAHEIAPDYGIEGYTRQGLDYVQGFMSSPMKHLYGSGNFGDAPAPDDIFPTIDIFTIYIQDLSINMTGHDVRMGQSNTSWAYTVPSFNSDIPTGLKGWEGIPNYRKASADDARIYPLRRKIIATSTKILYDDTSEWWHGQVPLARFSFDDWWCEALGFPLTRDVESMETDANSLLRGIVDSANIRLDPPIAYDENTVSERLALALNPRQPGQRVKLNMQMGEAIKPLLPTNYADQPAYIMDTMKYLNDQQDWIIGARDVMGLAKTKQIPSEGTIDKLLEMAGPLAQDMTRSMEEGMRVLGDQRRWLNLQFQSKRRLFYLLGVDNVTEEMFDFDPGNLIPSHMPDEDPQAGPSRYNQIQRAREFGGELYYHVTAHSMARTQSMSQKLIMLQLYQRNLLPSDPWSVAEDFEIEGFGPKPEGATNRMELWIEWERAKAKIAAEAQAQMGAAQQAQEGGGEPQAPQGRPNANTKAPQIRVKGDGRSTVTTS